MQARIQQLSKHVPDKRILNYAFSTQAIIGRGSYGVVYIGRNIDSGQSVAIKAISIQQNSIENQTLLQKEIDIMKDLDSPNIVKLIDVITTANNCYIISELCTGGDLKEYMKRSGPIEETGAIKILIQILRGILQSFKRGIIHRDLKPANILVANNSVFKIADFGFAKRFDKLDEDLMTSLVGTPLYMSPQVLLRRQYTSKCDVWSVGLIFYEMIEGKTPWNVRDILDLVNKQRNQKITFSKKISKQAQQFISGCLAYEEANRFGWEQVFTHPLFENAFERQPKKEVSQPPSNNTTLNNQTNKQQMQQPIQQQPLLQQQNQTQQQIPSQNKINSKQQQQSMHQQQIQQVFAQTQPLQQQQFQTQNTQQHIQALNPLQLQTNFPNTQNLTPQEGKQNKSMQMIPAISPMDDKLKRNTISPLQIHMDNRQIQYIKGKHYLKTHASPPNDEENKNNISNQKITNCSTQPNTQKKDRTVSVAHQKVESQQTTSRYSDNKYCREEQFKSERQYCQPKHLYQNSDPKFLFQRQSSENDEYTINRMLIQNQIEFLFFLKRLREQLLEFYGNHPQQKIAVTKLSFILLKHALIKTTDIKENLVLKQINILDLKDFENFRMSEAFRTLEKSILEIHFETFSQIQDVTQQLNGTTLDADFQDICNFNFEYSIHFVKLAYNLTAQFIKNFLYDQVLECSNVKIVNFTFLLGQFATHLQQMSFSPNDVNKLLSNCRTFKDDFRLKRVECLNLMDKLVVKCN